MHRINEIFANIKHNNRSALMPFLTAGYPSLDVTAAAIPALEDAGASVVEIGFPFSDPIADGPMIAESMTRALQSGTTTRQIFDTVQQVRSKTEIGIVAMVSYSIVNRIGPERFVTDAATAGFDGVIVPDLDLEAAGQLRDLLQSREMSLSLLIAPTTSDTRIKTITRLCSGFIYLLARSGITGEQDATPAVAERVARVRRYTDLPIAVGFGISTPAHVQSVTESADAAIVGSALVRRMGTADDPVKAAANFVYELAAGRR